MRPLLLLAAPCAAALAGCATLGAQSLPEVQASYNEHLALTQDTQFLLNIVRLRYRDTPSFLDVASLTTQQTLSGNLSLGTSVPVAPTPGLTASPGLGGSMSVTPTTTFSPVRGEDFVRRLVAPISLQSVAMVASSGWSVGRVLQLTVDRVNALTNAPAATGPTPDYPPDASRFLTLTRALRALQVLQQLSLSSLKDDGNGDSGVLAFEESAAQTEPFRTAHDLLDLPSAQARIRLTEDFTAPAPDSLKLKLRSLLGAMFFLSQAVEVPPEHEARGLVTVTRTADGGRYDWQQVLDGIFRVRWSWSEPAQAAVKVRHRGAWFYVADDDLESKSTFMLLVQLFNMQAGRGALPVPVLTIPAGR